MIYLRENEILNTLQQWEEVTKRPLFKESHNPTNSSLKEIIGYYELPTMIRCGLSSCHTEHMRGYLVGLNDGFEINIGHECGRSLFDVDFTTLAREFNNFRETEECKATLYEAKSKTDQWRRKINDLLNEKRGAKWALKQITAFKNRSNIGAKFNDYISAMVKLRKKDIQVNVELTDKKEIELRRMENPNMRHDEVKWIKKTIGTLEHLEALYPENDLQDLFIKQAQENINSISKCDPAKLSLTQLKAHRKMANDLPQIMLNCATALDTARNFLSHVNLKKLLPIFEDKTQFEHADRIKFMSFLMNIYTKAKLTSSPS